MTVSLRTRLTLFFVAIGVLPVTAVTILGWRAVARSSDRQVRSELEHSRQRLRALRLRAVAVHARVGDAVGPAVVL